MEETNLQPGQNLAHLLPPSWKADVQRWYAEDTPSFDWAGFVVGEEEQEAILWGKSGVSYCLSWSCEANDRAF
jgi:nicotinate-nucleotide pyrophosphorylase (carboxylating)